MQRIRGSLSYSNIVATLALFLALGGGVAYAAATLGKNSVKSGNIAAHAVKSRNLAKNAVKSQSLAASAVTEAKIKKEAVSASKVKKATLTRTNLAAGTLAGLQVAEVTATAVPGLTVEPENGTLVPLAGTATFTPQAGKSYELLTELKGTPTALGGPEAESCFAEVDMFVNGGYRAEASIFSRPNTTGPFYVKPIGSSATAIGLQEVGQPVTLSALSFGSTSCSPATTASLRAVVIELG
jgi:hypothetical protein